MGLQSSKALITEDEHGKKVFSWALYFLRGDKKATFDNVLVQSFLTTINIEASDGSCIFCRFGATALRK